MLKIKFVFVFALSLLITGGSSSISSVKNTADQYSKYASERENPGHKDGEYCPMHGDQVAPTNTTQSIVVQQDPPPPPPPAPPHQPSEGEGCSRPSKEDPAKGVKANTVGCNCVRKTPCHNEEPQEDAGTPEDKYKTRCKNYCYKTRCSCPNPCKS